MSRTTSRHRWTGRWYLTTALITLLFANRSSADDLQRLQGAWLCETRPYLVEFHDQVATFRGLNPFVQGQPCVSQYVEVSLPFSMHTDGDLARLEFAAEAFARAVDRLKFLPVQAVHFAKSPTASCKFEPTEANPAADSLQFTLAPGIPAHLVSPVYTNQDKLRRLTAAQIETFVALSGVWQGEIRCGETIVRSGFWAIIPGWVFEQTKVWEPPLPNIERAYPETTTLRVQLDPAAKAFTLWEPVTQRGLGLFQSTIWQNDVREYRGTFTVGEQGFEGTLLSPALTELVMSKDFDAQLATANLGFSNDAGGDAAARAANQKRRFDLGRKLKAAKGEMSIHATRAESLPGEGVLAAWLRTIHPDRPTQEQLLGNWKLKTKATWKPGGDGDGFEAVALRDSQTWIFSRGKLAIQTAGNEKSKVFNFSFFYKDNIGAILSPTPENVNQTIFCVCQLKENLLTILINRPHNWPDQVTTGTAGYPVQFTLERADP